jgi:hypothetical protein
MHQSSDLRLDDSPTDFIINDRHVVGRDREVYFWRIRELGESSFQPISFFFSITETETGSESSATHHAKDSVSANEHGTTCRVTS